MGRPRKNAISATTAAVQAQVIGSTAEEQKTESAGGDTVILSVSLRGGHVFDDIPDGANGIKSVRLAGLDDALKGKKSGILTPAGNAVFQQLPRADWEAIKNLHGAERMFNSWQGRPPCVFEIESVKAAKTGALADKIAAVSTGADPIDPASVGVTEAEK